MGGGGIFTFLSKAVITNNLIISNISQASGGAIYSREDTSSYINNVSYSNGALTGGGLLARSSHARFINNIFWGDTASTGSEIYVEYGTDPYISYCNIQGGWPTVGCIDVDPLFRDPDNGDFHLMATYCGDPFDSPCIDMGYPTIIDTLLDCAWGLGESRSDMGAYGGGDSSQVYIEDEDPQLPISVSLSQNYPNPFNSSTQIEFSIPYEGEVNLSVYNLMGRRVAVLLNEVKRAGQHSANWDAGGLASGIYFYRLTYEGEFLCRRMLLIK